MICKRGAEGRGMPINICRATMFGGNTCGGWTLHKLESKLAISLLADEFASMLAELLFLVTVLILRSQPAHLTEQLWSMGDLKFAAGKLKQNSSSDDKG